MNIIKPYKGLSRDRLSTLINSLNGRNRVENVDFTYGPPRAEQGPNGENTAVTITPVPGTTYRSPQDIRYTRLHISTVGQLPYNVIEPVFLPTIPFYIKDVLPEINRALGLNLENDEVINQQYTSFQEKYTLTIDENISLAWIGCLEFKATRTALKLLEDFITDQRYGFTADIVFLSKKIWPQYFDGFHSAPRQLEEALDASLNGFNPTPTKHPLSMIVTNVYLDIFDMMDSVCIDEFACAV